MQPINKLFLSFLLGCSSLVSIAKNEVPENFRQQSSLLFIENKGQVTDQHGAVRSDIDFKLQTPELTMFIGNGQLHYQWLRSEKQGENVKTEQDEFPVPFDKRGQKEPGEFSIYRMDVTLVGANSHAEVIAEDADEYYENYITPATGEKGITALSYKKLTYKNVYPNIDWVLYVNADQTLKYDFIVHPGGNLNDIKLRYDGATELKLHNGALTATTPYGSITEQAPYTYKAENKQQVVSSFVLDGNTLSFNVEKQNEGTLVIDPQLHWATYYGGSGWENIQSLCTDDKDGVYACGSTSSSNNIATAGAFLSVPSVSTYVYNGFIVKFNSLGKRLWGTYYHNGSGTGFSSMMFDTALYVLGICDTTGNPLTAGTHQQVYGGGEEDCILLRFTTGGNLVWGTYIGGAGDEEARTIMKGPKQDIYIVGETTSANGIATAGAHQTSVSGNQFGSSFVAKFTIGGKRIWGTYYGNGASAQNNGFIADACADRWGNLYFVGTTIDTSNVATAGAHQPKLHPATQNWYDGFLVKFDSAGKKIWGTYYGGNRVDGISSVDCDTSGMVYFVGYTTSTDSISTPGAFQVAHSGFSMNNVQDGFFVKFDSSGKRLWGTYYGNASMIALGCSLYDVRCANNGTIYIGGMHAGSGLATTGAYQSAAQGHQDIVLALFTNSGSRLWASYFGGPSADHLLYSNNIALSQNNDLYFGGYTQSKTGIATANAHQYYYAGGPVNQDGDGFLAKFTGDTLVSIDRLLPDTVCVGDIIPVYYRTTFPFKAGNSFKVQLSNASGSFANAVTIGTKTGLSTDTVHCLIPMNIPAGTGYKIRIVSSLRPDTSLESIDTIVINNVYPVNVDGAYAGPLCPYDTLRLNGSSVSANVKYMWSGPGGYSSTIANPVIDSAGKFGAGKYILHANLHGCVGRDTVNVSIKPLPYTGALAATAAVPCVADTFYLDMPAGAAGTTYSWAGPNNFTSTTRNPYIENATPLLYGNYMLTATLNGCSQKDTAILSALKPLPAKPDASANSPLCAGSNMQFNATTTTSGVTWSWKGPNSFSTTIQNPFILSTQPIHSGYYIVTATLNGCHARDTVAAVVNVIPAKPAITTNTPICENDSLRFSGVTTTAGVTYTWSGPQSFSGTAGDTVFKASTINTAGQYTLTVSKDGCSNTETANIVVKPLPVAVSVTNNSPICEGNTLQLTSGTSTSGSTYSWSGPGFSSGTQSPAIPTALPAATGWYYVTIELNGCTIKDSTQATVNPTPVLSATTANQPLCLGQALNLGTANINNATYSWTGPNGYAITGRTPLRNNMQYADTGWYRVVATANNCVSKADSVLVKLNPVPFVTIFAGKDSICAGNTATFTSLPNLHGGTPTYVWKINGVPSGVGNTFSTPLLNNGDIVSCDMTEYTKCNGQYVDASNDVNMVVMPWLVPSVSIVATPSAPIKAGQSIQFAATPVNGGTLPAYQWKRNSNNVQGATGASWSASTLNDNDEICMEMTSNYMCPQPASAKSNCIKVKVLTGIADNELAGSLSLYPNPNNGKFVLSGRLEQAINGAVNVEVLNTLGQVIYRDQLQLKSGQLYAELQLPQVASGGYLLRMSSAEVNHTLRFDVR